MRRTLILGVVLILATSGAHAGIGGAAREAAKFVFKKFGAKAAGEGVEQLAGRIATATARYGDDALIAVQKVGPKAIRFADDAGVHGGAAVKLLARHGDDGAAFVLSRPKAFSLFRSLGDDAAGVLIKHRGTAEAAVESFGTPAVQALKAVGPRAGRRLAILTQSGELASTGHAPELLGVIARHGDRAMDFIWRNKGSLAVGTAMVAFLANPEPFINGSTDLASAVAEHASDGAAKVVESVAKHAIEPVAVAAVPVVQETARQALWLLFAVAVGLAAMSFLAVRIKAWWRPACKAAARLIGHAWAVPKAKA